MKRARRKCQLLECKPVAIVHTRVEDNLVTINPHQLANPKYKAAIFFEILEAPSKPWDIAYVRLILIVHGIKYELVEVTDPDVRQNQTFTFTLLDDVDPQIERIIEQAIPDIL